MSASDLKAHISRLEVHVKTCFAIYFAVANNNAVVDTMPRWIHRSKDRQTDRQGHLCSTLRPSKARCQNGRRDGQNENTNENGGLASEKGTPNLVGIKANASPDRHTLKAFAERAHIAVTLQLDMQLDMQRHAAAPRVAVQARQTSVASANQGETNGLASKRSLAAQARLAARLAARLTAGMQPDLSPDLKLA
jgi:hypothetical protein